MIYKHMYCGYPNSNSIKLSDNEDIITSSAAVYENMVFVYFETKNKELTINDVAQGDLKAFPDGSYLAEMPEIFHYFSPRNDEQWCRKIENKTPVFLINKIHKDKIASYIYHHQDLQQHNPYNSDKFGSIFMYGNIGIIYLESPTENITWQDIEDRPYIPVRSDWAVLMNNHFMEWPDGHKGWVQIENIGSKFIKNNL